MRRLYEVRLTPNERDGYDAYVPSIDMTTAGGDVHDAVEMAYDLIYTAVPAMMQMGREVPRDAFEPVDGALIMGVMVDCDEDTPEVDAMTVKDAAGILGISESRVHALIKSGALDSRKEGTCRLVTTKSVRRRADGDHRAGRPYKEAVMA